MADFAKSLRWGAACLAAVMTTACGGSGGTPPELRETRYGVVRGTDDSATSGTYAWKGVPYAQPPVGALRWQPPAEPAAWTGERSATRFGSACLQMGRIYGPGANNRFDDTIGQTLNTPLGSEDCLTLNIWRPATAQDNLPVLVFIHGGSAISGYTADPVYDGAALAKSANAIVVTANYRLDVLGYLQLPALHAGNNGNGSSAGGSTYTGNYALLDVVQALRFVQGNIARFGGNAGNVTLMGQSAGAINALALLTAPQATGLFHKLVAVSGGISLASNLPAGSIPTLNPVSRYAAQASQLLAHLAVADGLAPGLPEAQALVASWPPTQVATHAGGQLPAWQGCAGRLADGAGKGADRFWPDPGRCGGSGRSDHGDFCGPLSESACFVRLHGRGGQAVCPVPGAAGRQARHEDRRCRALCDDAALRP